MFQDGIADHHDLPDTAVINNALGFLDLRVKTMRHTNEQNFVRSTRRFDHHIGIVNCCCYRLFEQRDELCRRTGERS